MTRGMCLGINANGYDKDGMQIGMARTGCKWKLQGRAESPMASTAQGIALSKRDITPQRALLRATVKTNGTFLLKKL